jgi:hypothetical protein
VTLLAALALAGCGGSAAKVASTTTQAAPVPAPHQPLRASVARVRGELGQVAQHGLLLGKASAPIQIIEYASLDCETCARVHRAVVPAVIDRFVRAGVASLEFRSFADTRRAETLALGAYAASAQRHGWEFVQLAYLRSLQPGTADSPARLAAALGLDGRRFAAELRNPEWPLLLKGAASVLSVAHFKGDPVFLVRRPGQSFTVLTDPRTVRQFTEAIVAAQRAHA